MGAKELEDSTRVRDVCCCRIHIKSLMWWYVSFDLVMQLFAVIWIALLWFTIFYSHFSIDAILMPYPPKGYTLSYGNYIKNAYGENEPVFFYRPWFKQQIRQRAWQTIYPQVVAGTANDAAFSVRAVGDSAFYIYIAVTAIHFIVILIFIPNLCCYESPILSGIYMYTLSFSASCMLVVIILLIVFGVLIVPDAKENCLLHVMGAVEELAKENPIYMDQLQFGRENLCDDPLFDYLAFLIGLLDTTLTIMVAATGAEVNYVSRIHKYYTEKKMNGYARVGPCGGQI